MILMYAALVSLLTKDGMDTLWRVLRWSFQAMADGRWPDTDAFGSAFAPGSYWARRAGEELAGGYRATIIAIQGDLDYFAKNLYLRHWASAHPCSFCPANNVEGDPLCWTEFRPEHAGWMGEGWTNPEWIAAHATRHELFHIPGIGIENVFVDWMHAKHLGVDKLAYASVMHILCYEIMPGVFLRPSFPPSPRNISSTCAPPLGRYKLPHVLHLPRFLVRPRRPGHEPRRLVAGLLGLLPRARHSGPLHSHAAQHVLPAVQALREVPSIARKGL